MWQNPQLTAELILFFCKSFDDDRPDTVKAVEDYIREMFGVSLYHGSKFDFFKNITYNNIPEQQTGVHDISSIERFCLHFNLTANQRLILFLYLIDFLFTRDRINDEIYEVLYKLSDNLFIRSGRFESFFHFITSGKETDHEFTFILRGDMKDDLFPEGSWIESHRPEKFKSSAPGELAGFPGKIIVFFYDHTGIFYGRLADQKVFEERSFFKLAPGETCKINDNISLHYQDLKAYYLSEKGLNRISLYAENIGYSNRKTNRGLKPFSFSEESGKLIGIVGNEGVGKTTFLNLLSGSIQPQEGQIIINGYNFRNNSYLLKNIMGYVRENDHLFDALTVKENLLLAAGLYNHDRSYQEQDSLVCEIMHDLKIYDLRDKKVGSILDKNLQPGQRRLVNTGIELLRDPEILLVDEAVEGLNMADASAIIKVLSGFTFRGKLIITSISQTSEDAFKLFDKILVIDEGGYPVYYGNPAEAVSYFKDVTDPGQESPGYTENRQSAARVIDILEKKRPYFINENNVEREVSPEQWYTKFLNKTLPGIRNEKSGILPPGNYRLPPLGKQFAVYSLRNFKTRFSNFKQLVISLFAGPLVAAIMALSARLTLESDYVPAQNNNLPLYLFLSTLVMLFLGLVMSAGEILKEKDLLNKEEFLNYSRFSYINAKIVFLFLVALLQSFLYALTGNLILQVEEMTLYYWLVLFSMESLGIILGLLFSSFISKLSNIYGKVVPLVLLINLLLGGGIIPYYDAEKKQLFDIPSICEIIPARWAYEAMLIAHYTMNPYEREIFGIEKQTNEASFYYNHLIPWMESAIHYHLYHPSHKDSLEYDLTAIRHGLVMMAANPDVFPFEYTDQLNTGEFSTEIANETLEYLTYLALVYYDIYENGPQQKAKMLKDCCDRLGYDDIASLRNRYHNIAVENILLDKEDHNSLYFKDSLPVNLTSPVYREPLSNTGRACFGSSVKQFNYQFIDTIWFNITVMWVLSFMLYVILLSDAVNRLKNLGKFNQLLLFVPFPCIPFIIMQVI